MGVPLKSVEIALQYLNDLKNESLEYIDFEKTVHAFIVRRFDIEGEPGASSNRIDELADLSVRKMLRLAEADPSLAEPSLSCEGESSPEAKRFLVIAVLQKRLGVKIPPKQSIELETTEAVSRALYTLLH